MSQQRKQAISDNANDEPARFILVPKWLSIAILVLLLITCFLVVMLWKPWHPAERQTQVEPPVEVKQTEQGEQTSDYKFYELLPQQKVTPLPNKSMAAPEPVEETTETKANTTPSNTKNNTATAQNTAKPVEKPVEVITTPPPAMDEKPVQVKIQSSENNAAKKYIVYVNRYDDPEQAEALRSKMIEAGVSTEVAVHMENDRVWYRVLSGPYSNEKDANQAQKQLAEQGIPSNITTINGN